MALQSCSRRRLIAASAAAIAGTAGCVSEAPGTVTDSATPPERSPDTSTPTSTPADGVKLVALSVDDFVLYPLSGTHPHVHRRAEIQYVVVRVATASDWGTVSEAISLELDGEATALAERQPVSWDHDDVELAFAVPKDRQVERGVLRFEGEALRELSPETNKRLNNPPEFHVASPSVSPGEIQEGETVSATVSFSLSNDGAGSGTFGASLKGNYVSGANTVTATLESGAEREIRASVTLHGEGEDATVRLDWGVDEWVTGMPVVGTATE